MIWRIIGSVIGLALFIVAIPLTLSPLPVGLLLLFLSVVILVASNPLAARLLRWARRRWPWLNRFFRKAERVLPREVAGPLHETDNPDDEDGEADKETAKASYESLPVMRRPGFHRRLR